MKRGVKIFFIAFGVFLLLIIIFFIYCSVPKQMQNKEISGFIIKNQIWSGEILVVGDIIVLPWTTLSIMPRTNVTITANKDIKNLVNGGACDGIKKYDLQIGIKREDNTNCGVNLNEPYRDEKHHISILVFGTLNAVGTEEERIVFKSNSKNPTIYDWNTLLISKGILSYANLESYRALPIIDDFPIGGDVEISNNNLRYIGECGICVNSNKAKIYSNNISYAGHELIDMHESSPVIQYNNLGPNPKNACIIIDRGSPEITFNKIKECGLGLAFIAPPENPIIEDNIFLNNTQNIVHEYSAQ